MIEYITEYGLLWSVLILFFISFCIIISYLGYLLRKANEHEGHRFSRKYGRRIPDIYKEEEY